VRDGWNTCESIGGDLAFDPKDVTDEQQKALEHILVQHPANAVARETCTGE
jgi:hypothetical protein